MKSFFVKSISWWKFSWKLVCFLQEERKMHDYFGRSSHAAKKFIAKKNIFHKIINQVSPLTLAEVWTAFFFVKKKQKIFVKTKFFPVCLYVCVQCASEDNNYKIFVWRKKVYKKFSWKKKFHLNTTTWDGIFVKNKSLVPTKNQQQNDKKLTYLQISMFFDICDLTMRTESPILLLLSPSTKFDVNLFDDILLPTPLKKYSFSQKKFWNLQKIIKNQF